MVCLLYVSPFSLNCSVGGGGIFSALKIQPVEAVPGDWAAEYSTPSGTGAKSNPYIITTPNELAYFSNSSRFMDKTAIHIKLNNDIDLSANLWTPIYIPGCQIYFDGQGFLIIGLNITQEKNTDLNATAKSNAGLFAQVHGGEIKDFTLEGLVGVASTNKDVRIGGLAGLLLNTVVENVTSKVRVVSSACYTVGGVVGEARGSSSVKNCIFEGSLMIGQTPNNSTGIGGIVGMLQTSADSETAGLRNCISRGDYVKGYTNIGGIAGGMKGVITDCVNYTPVFAISNSAGGIAGASLSPSGNETGLIVSCFNYGNINANNIIYVGGIIGDSRKSIVTIFKCGSFGNLTGAGVMGGIIGVCNSGGGELGKIENCIVEGSITKSMYSPYVNVAGIVAEVRGAGLLVKNCYYRGHIFTDASEGVVSGLIGGASANIEISSCFVDATVQLKEAAVGSNPTRPFIWEQGSGYSLRISDTFSKMLLLYTTSFGEELKYSPTMNSANWVFMEGYNNNLPIPRAMTNVNGVADVLNVSEFLRKLRFVEY